MFQIFWSAPTLEAFKKNLAPHLADLLGLYSCLEQGVGLDGSLFHYFMVLFVFGLWAAFLNRPPAS